MKPKKIRDICSIRPHPTVVRLDDIHQKEATWIRESYCITGDVEKHLAALKYAFGAPVGTGVFLIGQYGSGKSHLLAWLISTLEEGSFVKQCPKPISVSLLNFSSDVRLEDVVSRTLNLPASSGDRRETWEKLDGSFPNGLVLMLDELSEFLRSKPTRRSFNEDVRFLQYMGEWAKGHRLWVIGALQEQIERTGDLEREIYRKIKDRYPLRLLLTETHVRDLISKSILIKTDLFDETADEIVREMRGATPPAIPFNVSLAKEIYPVHPATIKFLEEVRGQFSQARGIVDFTVRQLGGDPTRNIPPFIDRQIGDMLTPDFIFDHYEDLLLVQPDFTPIAEKLLPHYREHMGSLFEREGQRTLAWRLVKLLALAHISPSRQGLSPKEATYALAFTSLKLDVSRNEQIVGKILSKLASKGRYVHQQGSEFSLNLDDDSAGTLERLLLGELADIEETGESLFEEIVPHLKGNTLHPFSLPREKWQPRETKWHFHSRRFSVYLGQEEPPSCKGIGLCIRLPWGQNRPAQFVTTVIPGALEVDRVVREAAALARIMEKPLDKEVANRAARAFGDLLAQIQARIAGVYARPTLYGPAGSSETKCTPIATDNPGDWLSHLALFVLRRRYPSFEAFAPTTGPLPHDAYRTLLNWLGDHDIEEIASSQHVDVLREGYMVPMGLLKRTARGYGVPAKLERSDLIKLLLPLLDSHPEPKIVYEYLADSLYGLVPDQIHVLLIFLLAKGEVEIVKGGGSLRKLYETFPIPLQYDRVERATALDTGGLKFLAALCDGLGIRPPAEWSVLAQDRTATLVRDSLKTRTGPLEILLAKLRSDGGSGPLTSRIVRLLDWVRAFDNQKSALEGLGQLRFEAETASFLLSEIGALEELPKRIDQLVREKERYRHLLANLNRTEIHTGAATRKSPGNAPSLEEPEALEKWLENAGRFYEHHKILYTSSHDTYWQNTKKNPILKWALPRLARSRHLGLEESIATFEETRQTIQRGICSQLANLNYQPVCHCGFNGNTAPIEGEIEKLETITANIDEHVARFFAKESVRRRISKWLSDGLEATPATVDYADKKAPLPDIDNLDTLDEYLSGLEIVQTVETERIASFLESKTWDKDALIREFQHFVTTESGSKLRFQSRETGKEGALDVAKWCLERALSSGVSLPKSLPVGSVEKALESVHADWVSRESLERLSEMGLPHTLEDRIVTWLLRGELKGSRPENSSLLIASAIDIIEPQTPDSPEDLAALVTNLYGSHHRMMDIAQTEWMSRLNQVANWPGLSTLEHLTPTLKNHQNADWVIVDCFGISLVDVVKSAIEEHLPGRRFSSVQYLSSPLESTTEGLYREFSTAGHAHGFFKLDFVDAMIHERFLPFPNMVEIIRAELGISLPSLRKKLDPDKPLIVFGDHGFSIAEDGHSYCHNTRRPIERIVPLLTFLPI